MEELQDAIEDAQYVNAIATQLDGPRPVLTWDKPDEEQLSKWEETKKKEASKDPNGLEVFGIDWCMQSAIGFFLFAEFLKDTCDDWLRINFIEDIILWKKMRGKQRLERAKRIVEKFLKKVPVNKETGKPIYPAKRQIDMHDMYRDVPKLNLTKDQIKELLSTNPVAPYDAESSPKPNALGLTGPVVDEIYDSISQVENNRNGDHSFSSRSFRMKNIELESTELKEATKALPDRKSIRDTYSTMKQLTESLKLRVGDPSFLNNLFCEADVIIIESLRKEYWQQFTESENFAKLKNFLWYYDRPVLVDDFFSMRVLGRGGFGSVTGKQEQCC